MTSNERKTLDAYLTLSLRDLDALSDDELRAELEADGVDTDALAHSIAYSLDEVVAAFLREQVADARSTGQSAVLRPERRRRPPIERIKQLIQDAMRRDPQLATAFREGTRQTESDLESLYDDLVLMGKIRSDDENA